MAAAAWPRRRRGAARGEATLGFAMAEWEEEGGTRLLFVGRLVALACASGAGARQGSRPEITAGRCCASGGCGRKGKGRQVGSGGQRGRRARGRVRWSER